MAEIIDVNGGIVILEEVDAIIEELNKGVVLGDAMVNPGEGMLILLKLSKSFVVQMFDKRDGSQTFKFTEERMKEFIVNVQKEGYGKFVEIPKESLDQPTIDLVKSAIIEMEEEENLVDEES